MPELWIGDLEVGEVRETTAVAVLAVGGVRRNREGQRSNSGEAPGGVLCSLEAVDRSIRVQHKVES